MPPVLEMDWFFISECFGFRLGQATDTAALDPGNKDSFFE